MQDTGASTDYRLSLRERILDTAMSAFAENGIKAVRMDDIAHKMGISKRTLYEIFENKEVLLYEGVKKFRTRKEQQMILILSECSNVMDMLLRAYMIYIDDFKRTNPLFYSDLEKYPRILAYLDEHNEQGHERFMSFLRRGVSEGYFRPDVDYELAALMLDAICRHIMSNQLYKQYAIEDIFKSLLFVSLRGFCTQLGVDVLDRFLSNGKR